MNLGRWNRVVVIDVGSPERKTRGWFSKGALGDIASGDDLSECGHHLANAVCEQPLDAAPLTQLIESI